jgi:hypothetical protein
MANKVYLEFSVGSYDDYCRLEGGICYIILVDAYQFFERKCLHFQGGSSGLTPYTLKREAVVFSETLISTFKIVESHTPQDNVLKHLCT